MHDHDIKGVFRYQHWSMPEAKGLPGEPGDTVYIPFQFITSIELNKSSTVLYLRVMGGHLYYINRSSTMLRFFEEYMAYQNAHERGI
jgi:hypothetical protein